MIENLKIGKPTRYGADMIRYRATYLDRSTERESFWLDAAFHQSAHGGSVFIEYADGHQTRIDSTVADRCGGTLSPSFIERFYA